MKIVGVKKTSQAELWFIALLMGICSSSSMVFLAIVLNHSFQWWTIGGRMEHVLIGTPCLIVATMAWKLAVFRKTQEYLVFE